MSSGVIRAGSVEDAASRLRSMGKHLVNVTPSQTGIVSTLDKLRKVSIDFNPGLKDVQSFTNQLAVMIRAGINIRGALEGIGQQIENPKFRTIIMKIKSDVEAGRPFSEALQKHPKVFNTLYVNMVRASELSGNFAGMLERIESYTNQQVETRRMVRGAMVYPAIIGLMAIGTTTFLLTFVLPKFTVIFKGKEAILPTPTLVLIATSFFIRTYWYVVIGGIIALVGALVYAVRTPLGRQYWDTAKLHTPIFKRMFSALYITRSFYTMGELIIAGVPMLDTLSITAQVSGNTLYRRMWLSVQESVKQGAKIATSLDGQSLMPKNVLQMIAAGEESGRLGNVMRDVGEYYSKKLQSTIKTVTSLIEPLMILIMGVLVGFIAMSIVLPIFKMSTLVK